MINDKNVTKMNEHNFEMDDWAEFSIEEILAHLVDQNSHEEVQNVLDLLANKE